jgi:hypothetical protein
MGTYYDIVCPIHKEVLHLWKADNLWGKLEYLVAERKLEKERVEPDSAYTEFIVVKPSEFRVIIRERPRAKKWLQRHDNCKLFFLDSEYSDTFDYYEDFTQG